MSHLIGLKHRAETVVTEANTAAAMGSGDLPVFATPAMIALMEQAAATALLPQLEAGMSSVGIRLDVSHDAATPLGMKVWAEAEVTAVEGKRVLFAVAAYDNAGLIGKGIHERCIINAEKFLAKTAQKQG